MERPFALLEKRGAAEITWPAQSGILQEPITSERELSHGEIGGETEV